MSSQEESDDNSSDSSSDICGLCGGTPCDWDAMHELLVERGDELCNNVDASGMKKVRKAVCQLYVYLKLGSLVKTRMVRVPECVMREIRAHWHD
ncbi:hypothetical protein GN958_ATG18058 [Phytophthora infestans]|uniref:Uncharacterized protein n=1 Tax=Phytophthora infestans TaxID=4787 RepID=A0A8S9TXM6_PHYIN|nr:hypothetical protein GN958_ATG19253 [Phytophthora infestans]KAF4132760.1 hypothetical protein GN958_ATG18058 [Phytophthora infestans]